MSPCSSPAPPASLYQSCDPSRPPPLLPSPNPRSGGHGVVSVTTILKSGPLGPSPGEVLDGAAGHRGPWVKGQGWGKDVKWVSEMSAQLGGSPMPSVVGTIPLVSQVQSLAEVGVLCAGVDPPRAQGKAVVLGVCWTPVSAFSPPGGAWGSGVGMSSSSTMFSGWNQRRGGARAPSTGTPEAQVGSHSHATEEQGGGGSFGFVPVGLSTALGRDGLCVGPAEQVGLFAFSKPWSCFRR